MEDPQHHPWVPKNPLKMEDPQHHPTSYCCVDFFFKSQNGSLHNISLIFSRGVHERRQATSTLVLMVAFDKTAPGDFWVEDVEEISNKTIYLFSKLMIMSLYNFTRNFMLKILKGFPNKHN